MKTMVVVPVRKGLIKMCLFQPFCASETTLVQVVFFLDGGPLGEGLGGDVLLVYWRMDDLWTGDQHL